MCYPKEAHDSRYDFWSISKVFVRFVMNTLVCLLNWNLLRREKVRIQFSILIIFQIFFYEEQIACSFFSAKIIFLQTETLLLACRQVFGNVFQILLEQLLSRFGQSTGAQPEIFQGRGDFVKLEHSDKHFVKKFQKKRLRRESFWSFLLKLHFK